MDFQSIWQALRIRDRRDLYIALTVPVIAATVIGLGSKLLSRPRPNVFASPRKALQLLSNQDVDNLPYPPDALPGARDVDTCYGNIRVYEWGPEDGRKVLLVHGISTPSIAFAGMAKLLVERGCRVMMFDLFGRGYSDAPNPELHKQDIALWTSQILLVLSSSKLAWTGSDRFTLVGYSMGGGISTNFTSYFPDLVESLVLIAPAGLLRPNHISRSSKLLYSNLIPTFIANYYVGKRLRGSAATGAHPATGGKRKATAPAEVAESEIPGHPALAADSTAPIFPDRPRLSIADAVAWETDAHPGFLASFISSIKFAPITNQHERWRQIGRRCEARRAASGTEKTSGLDEDKVLVLLGAQDAVIVADETEEDATAALGKENIKVVRLRGGHDLPIVNSTGCVDAMLELWNSSLV